MGNMEKRVKHVINQHLPSGETLNDISSVTKYIEYGEIYINPQVGYESIIIKNYGDKALEFVNKNQMTSSNVTLSESIGDYESGATTQSVLSGLYDRIGEPLKDNEGNIIKITEVIGQPYLDGEEIISFREKIDTNASAISALTDDIAELSGVSHSHANKELLDTYTQTEENLADAVAKKHEHTNKTELDKITDGDVADWRQAKADIDAFLTDNDVTSGVVDTLKEIQEYITSDGEAADKMVKDIAAAQSAADAAQGEVDALEAVVSAETAAREEADADLLAKINAEVLARATADTNLQIMVEELIERITKIEESLKDVVKSVTTNDPDLSVVQSGNTVTIGFKREEQTNNI